ncbi:MAG: hypothetical protein Q8918_11580 [Bacteroidota bacterium]|nr:hypothetical protein [Bacteroidota bacterium]MDP4214307.1 hypothetical protein [Bacteroidota bacterium]MDP4250739.1 hypothetical protein [Bacteroidota bacterium]
MTSKSIELSREEIEKLIVEYELKPALKFQNLYIASGPDYEILASLKPGGRYDVQLLDKKQVEKSVQDTIRIFRDYANGLKS